MRIGTPLYLKGNKLVSREVIDIDGKYGIGIVDNGREINLLRNGELWVSSPTYSKMFIAIAYTIEELRKSCLEEGYSNIEQRVITVGPSDGSYYNFFFTPGSVGSLQTHSNFGWIVKEIIRLGDDQATIILQKKIK